MVKSKLSMTAVVSRSDSVDTSYWGSHRPGNPLENPDYTPTIDQLASGRFRPTDYLEHPEWYLDIQTREDRRIVSILRKVQGDPDAVVTVYRGSPSDELNTGDWVTLSRGYAEDYADYEGGKVSEFTARASEISFDGDDIREFGYWGKRQRAR